jgi:hypothetical protein
LLTSALHSMVLLLRRWAWPHCFRKMVLNEDVKTNCMLSLVVRFLQLPFCVSLSLVDVG